MRPQALLFVVITSSLLAACAVTHKVTLSHTTEVYSGTLVFDGPYTGTLTIPKGPDGESFSGRYVATDMTSVAQGFGASSAGPIEATGVWVGQGSRGSTIQADVKVGRGGHGIGTAKHSNGKVYQVSF